MALKPRNVIVGIVALAVWGGAIKMYLDYREANKLEAQKEAARAEARKPKPVVPPKFGPGIGDFETYFNEQHPLSKKIELSRRLALRPPQLAPTTAPGIAPGVTEDSYDIAQQIYRIYVPDNYSPQVPHGIIYYLGYKDTLGYPAPWKQTLDEKHLIFISIRSSIRPEWQHAAAALDAVANLKKQYTIDEKRIYLFDFPDQSGLIGLQMGLGLPDIFTGFVHIDRLNFYRPVPVPGTNQVFRAGLGAAPADLLAAAKNRPQAFVIRPTAAQPGAPNRTELFKAAFEQEGFTKLLMINLTDPEEVHYPNFHGAWLGQTLAFIERQ